MVRNFFSGSLKPASGLPFPGFVERVAQREGDFAAASLQQVEVLGAGLGHLRRGLGAGHGLAVDLRQGDAHRVIHAGRAAGEDGDEFLGVGRRGKGQGRCGEQQAADTLHG
jgi:hypothetical protein